MFEFKQVFVMICTLFYMNLRPGASFSDLSQTLLFMGNGIQVQLEAKKIYKKQKFLNFVFLSISSVARWLSEPLAR